MVMQVGMDYMQSPVNVALCGWKAFKDSQCFILRALRKVGREQTETPAQTIGALRYHVESRNMYHFKMEGEQQFQVFKSPEELLKFHTGGTATCNNVVGHQVVSEVEQS